MDSDWGASYEQDEEHSLQMNLLVFDQDDDPLRVPYFFSFKNHQHRHEAVQLVEQEELHFYLLTLKDGQLIYVARRSVAFPDDLKKKLATTVRDMLTETQT